MNKFSKLIAVVVILASLLLTACGGSATQSAPAPVVVVETQLVPATVVVPVEVTPLSSAVLSGTLVVVNPAQTATLAGDFSLQPNTLGEKPSDANKTSTSFLMNQVRLLILKVTAFTHNLAKTDQSNFMVTSRLMVSRLPTSLGL
ncbi:MAG: hypothetical protein ACD_19C00431G0004 [uncultured bacterium]|nr:MAG: hypothetical protein ACD_19C00431G0004 [uncultured bacterium]